MPDDAVRKWRSTPLLAPRDPGSPGASIRLGGEGARIGRDPSSDLVIPEATVSRRHARILWDGDDLVLEDLGSSGGTFVNNVRAQRVVLQPGDVIRLGPRVEYRIETETPSTSLRLAAARDSTEEGLRQLQVLLEVARALNVATVLDEVLEIVLQAAVRLMKADRGCVVLLGDDATRTGVAVYPRDTGEMTWAEHSSLVERAIHDRRTAIAGGVEDVTKSMLGRGVGMAAAAPLLVARRPVGSSQEASFVARVEAIGGIVMERAALGAGFSPAELAIFESLAADAALAIDGAHLYKEAREKAKIEHEMSLARTIQMALLQQPPQAPFAEVYAYSNPARSVGGDLYHGELRGDGALAVEVGDVSGKGVAASLIMAMAQGQLSLLHGLGLGLEEMMALLNQNLGRHNPGNRFLTLVSALIHPDGTLQVANAGHCPLAIVRRTGSVDLVSSHGPVLGILPVGVWPQEMLALEPGDSLVMYSDGVSESFSPEGEELGIEGVVEVLKGIGDAGPEPLTNALLEAAAKHRHGREADDDVTVLAARYTGGGEV